MRRIVFVFVPRARLVPRDAAVASQPMQSFFRLLCSVRTIKIVSVRVCDPAGTVETNGTLPVLHYALPLYAFSVVSSRFVLVRCVALRYKYKKYININYY